MFSLAEAFVHSDANKEDAEEFYRCIPFNIYSAAEKIGFVVVGTDEDGAVRARLQLKN